MSYEEACTLPCAGVTAWNSLHQPFSLKSGQTLLIQGTGGVSLFSLQFAKNMGLRTIAITSTKEKEDLLYDMGASHVINYRQNPDWYKNVLTLTDNLGVDRIIEIGGKGTILNSFKSCHFLSQIALIGFVSNSNEKSFDFMELFKSGAIIQPFKVGSKDDFKSLLAALSLNHIHPVIHKIFDFSDSISAWNELLAHNNIGKVVISNF